MPLKHLLPHLRPETFAYVEEWLAPYRCEVSLAQNRNSKLGDYRKLPDLSHKITINITLEADLFFFVLTHEIAHLLAFEKFGKNIKSHGKEWKHVFGMMLRESIEVYPQELQPLLLRFSLSPKANFMAAHELVQYFRRGDLVQAEFFLSDAEIGALFIYRDKKYEIMGKRKKNYLCKDCGNGKLYIFSPFTKITLSL